MQEHPAWQEGFKSFAGKVVGVLSASPGPLGGLRSQSHLVPLQLNAQCLGGAQGVCTEPRWRHFWLCKPRKSKVNAAMIARSTDRLVLPALSPCLHAYLRGCQKCAGGNRKTCFTSKRSSAGRPKLTAESGWSRQGCPRTLICFLPTSHPCQLHSAHPPNARAAGASPALPRPTTRRVTQKLRAAAQRYKWPYHLSPAWKMAMRSTRWRAVPLRMSGGLLGADWNTYGQTLPHSAFLA